MEKLPEAINSNYDEISPVVSRDGKTLFFTRVGYPEFDKTLILDGENQASFPDFDSKLKSIYYQLGGERVFESHQSKFNQDVWTSTADPSGNFKTAEHPDFPLNNAFPNSVVCLTPDPRTLYVVNQFPENGGIERGFSVIQKMSDGTWSSPQPVEIDDFYTITSDVSLTMSLDGNVLILAAERFDSENMDLFVCFRSGENRWTAPQHLGKTINSKFREATPYLSEDNKTLFFSSNRDGNHDIFLSKRLDETWQNWSFPQPLSEPINSSWADDSQPYFNMSSGFLYFTSKRGGGSDVYRIQIAQPQPTEIAFSGRIINEKTGSTVSGVLIRYATISGQANYSEDENGLYKLTLPKGVRFFVKFQKDGFAAKREEFFLDPAKRSFQEVINRDVLMQPLEVNSKIDLDPVFFVQSKALILEKSFPALKKLADFLKENPNISIRVEGHTDNVGKENELIRLSEDRANALKNFLLKEGIEKKRVETIGFGDKFPLNDNSTEELKKVNRRVEIRIIKN